MILFYSGVTYADSAIFYISEYYVLFQTLVYSMKDDMRDLAANLYGVIVCNQSHDERIREALDDFYSALSDKVLLQGGIFL